MTWDLPAASQSIRVALQRTDIGGARVTGTAHFDDVAVLVTCGSAPEGGSTP